MEYRYRTDDEMKDSGVEWIGKIPRDWELIQLKHLISKTIDNRGKTPIYGTEGIPMLEVKQITNGTKFPSEEFEKFVSEDIVENFIRDNVKEGDVLISTVGATSGKAVIVGQNPRYFIAQNVIGFRFYKKVCKNFIYYAIVSNYFKSSLKMINKSNTIDNLKVSIFTSNNCVITNIKEQEKIARFLDEKTSQFDSIISKKEALIQRLEEAKKSLISEVVTGKVKVVKTDDGVELVKRSSNEMKNSGVEWLGEIPKDWDAKRLKYLFNIKKNIAGKLGYDVLSVTQSGIKIKDITKNEGQLSMDYSKYQIVDIGDFIMNHMDLLTGFVDCSKFEGVTSPDYRVFRLIDKANSRNYYNYIFQFCYYNRIFYNLGQGVSSMGRWRLQTDTFKNFIVPKPSIEEQKDISIALENKIKDIEKLKNKLLLNIRMLKEAKQSLISEAVTGKIEILD